MKADLVQDPSADTLGPNAVIVSGLTADGVEILSDRLQELSSEAVAAEPERTPHVVLRPARPELWFSRTVAEAAAIVPVIVISPKCSDSTGWPRCYLISSLAHAPSPQR